MAGSHMTELFATASNIRNQFTFRGEYGWNENLEASLTYERYLNDYFRVFGGVNVENEMEDSLDELETTAIGGVRYLLPMLINSELRIDNKLRPQIALSGGIMVFPRIEVFGEYEYKMDFGWNTTLPPNSNFENEQTWQAGVEYVAGKNTRLFASYDNRFGAGAGLSLLFNSIVLTYCNHRVLKCFSIHLKLISLAGIILFTMLPMFLLFVLQSGHL